MISASLFIYSINRKEDQIYDVRKVIERSHIQ